MSVKPELLFLAHRIPYPPDKGDKIRSWRVFEYLRARFRVHLGCFIDDPADKRYKEYLESYCESAFIADLDPRLARMSALRAFASGAPLSFAYFHSRRLAQWIDAVRARPLAAEFAFSSSMAPYLEKSAGGRPRFVDLCDADSAKWREYAAQRSWPMSQVYRREARLLEREERRIINWADAAFAISEAEAETLGARAWFGNGVDADYFDPYADFDMTSNGAEFVFVGAMDYWANIDAVQWFANDVWPLIRARAPESRFAIVGARPASAVRALEQRDGICVVGRVPDVRPYIAKAKAVVAPMRIARGVQNKVLEAMAMGRPVAATTAAATGIECTTGDDIVIANAADDFASTCVALLEDNVRGDRIGRRARARMQSQYAWPTQLARLQTALDAHIEAS
ncbi:MAG: TIGR03087 family PEP-CTERM/XrtA system glycosyltransferase [Pseudomonadota bacterium]